MKSFFSAWPLIGSRGIWEKKQEQQHRTLNSIRNLLEKFLIRYQLEGNATAAFLTRRMSTKIVVPTPLKWLHVSDPRENHDLQKHATGQGFQVRFPN